MYAAPKVKGKRSKYAKRRSIEEGIPERPTLAEFEVVFNAGAQENEDQVTDIAAEAEAGEASASHDDVNQQEEDVCKPQEISDASVSFAEEVNVTCSSNELSEALEGLVIGTSHNAIEEENVAELEERIVEVEEKVKENAIATVPNLPEYNKLANEVKACAQELNEPSAPLSGENVSPVSDTANYLFSECLQEPAVSLKKCRELSNYNISYVVEDVLSPLSDEELSEFYLNDELKSCDECIEEFLKQELNDGVKMQNYLYNLLVQYLKSRKNFKSNEIKIQSLDKELDYNIQSIWTIWNDVEVTETEKCKDGNNIAFVHRYMQAKFNSDAMKRLRSTLSGMRRILYENQAMDSFSSLVLKFKIECYLHALMTSCPEFTNLAQNSPAKLQSGFSNLYFQQCVSDLKISISTLFLFQRKHKTDMDQAFLEESRQWLSDLVAILIRIGTWRDHIFILNHIMRCPGGVGSWGARFIQTPYTSKPSDPFSDPELNHIMTVMSVILKPITKREDFLYEWNSVVANEDLPWVVIDSDGEDDDDQSSCPLKENDLVLLLNQIPFAHLFKSILRFENGGCEINYLTVEHLYKLFSFCTDFIKILHTGLQLYSTQRYKQFSKRLGRLIRHVVQYATDELIIFKSLKTVSVEDSMKLQVEYDNFFSKSAKFIYSSQKHGAWQFLAVVPYNMASPNAILKLYGLLQLNKTEQSNKLQINLLDFEEKFAALPESEQFYLLSTFTNMALARDLSEIDFIKTILMQIFYVGFLGNLTKDQCYKNTKSLLFNICSVHPFLISEILKIQQENFLTDANRDQSLTVYLWMELPLGIWIPSSMDLEVLSSWLIEPLGSVRNELARIILRSLNYKEQRDLFLHPAIHRFIAHMILKANVKLIPDTEANMMKNVSNLVRSANNPQQSFQQWSWNLLLRLRLHLFDQADEFVRKSVENLPDDLRKIPDIESEKELNLLVDKKHPIACFIALTTTTLGHSVPIIFSKGFSTIEVLLTTGNYEIALSCIEYVTLMFLECRDSLHKCEKFITVLSQIIAADYSYLKYAKNLIASDFPGPILKSFENMIQNQIRKFGFMGQAGIIEMWMLSLTKIPMWTQEPGIVYLVDKLIKNGFYDNASRASINVILNTLLENTASPSETKSSFSSLVSWMNSYTPPSLLPKGYNGEAPWLAFKAIEIEHEAFELKTSLWQELLKELFFSSDKKTSVDNSLKKACNVLQIPVRPSSSLAIYKWVYQILETNVSHPLVILIWQKFFILYLNRVPGLVDRGSVGEKFFHGIINQALLKRLKQRLKETQDHYSALADGTDSEDLKHEFYTRCLQLLQTFMLWLDEPRLHDQALSIHLLPAQCNPQLLGLIVHGNTTPWVEYLDHDQVLDENKNCITAWLKVKNRWEKKEVIKSFSNSEEKKSPGERIQDRLKSYEIPLAPPALNLKKSLLPPISRDLLMKSRTMISYLQPSLKIIFDYTEQYIIQINEYAAIGCDVQDLLKRLYKTKETKVTLQKKCNGYYKQIDDAKIHCSCSGPATVTFRLEESALDQRAKEYLNQTIKQFNANVQRAGAPLSSDLGVSAVLIDNAVRELKKEYLQARDEKSVKNLKETGVALFYYFVKSWSENVTLTPAIAKAFSDYVDDLGKMFISENPEECLDFLKTITKTPKLILRLCDYFTPNAASIKDFIDMYGIVVDWTADLMYVVLSKFDLVKWLVERKPKFADRSRLISLIGKGLKADGYGPSKNMDVRELLNHHLQILLLHDFPEHYGEVLRFLLEASESQSISTSTWFTFLNALVPQGIMFVEGLNNEKSFEPGQSVKKLKHYFSKYATEQNLLSLVDIQGTISLLASSFKTDRLKHGLYGLYPKYRRYIEPIFIFFGMLSHSCVAKALQVDLGSLSDKIIEQLWPFISDLFSPWLIPYWTKNEKSQAAVWIQELTDDRCVLLPWIINDFVYANFCASIFVESVRFILDTLPGVNSVLSYVWYFYVINYAHPHVKDHVVGVVHKNLLSLPWNIFFPNLQDVEMMLKVVDQFLPLSHCFLGSVFVEIKWTDIVQFYLNTYDAEVNMRLHICLLNLLVKLPSEPSLKQNKTVTTLLTEADNYAWHLVDSSSYDSVLNWFVMSCDPRIILMDERSEYYHLDSIILRLLQTCAGYVATAKQFHPTTLTKRLMFIRASVKWLITANSRFKCKQTALFKSAICTILSDIETIVTATVPAPQRVDEAGVLLSEFMNIFKEADLAAVVEETTLHWLSTRRAGVVVYGILKSAGLTVDNPNIYGNIVEACLENYFESTENCNWNEVISILVSFSSPHSCLEKYLISNNNFLTLYAILCKRFQRNSDGFEERMVLNDLLQILSSAKFSDSIEPKLVLLLIYIIKLVNEQNEHNKTEAISSLVRLIGILNNCMTDKGSGILTTLGLRKSSQPSNRFKLVSLASSGGIMMVFKKTYKEFQDKVDEKLLQSLDLLDSNKQFQNINHEASYVKNIVKNVTNLEEVIRFLNHVSTKLFNKLYLQ